ncbi:cell wall metabolism sensor histidine kinase WalK [Paenibacillus chitinolyticus]|uniref:cell wall metabolism sensor histidine kinase WalK n=1 Tax=Paenibacillus chitinolyticus TaxID=79263 RepID=UPI001C461D27|nr:cell wall metabolism sensor histidine kinase WalK [Paenibacillus chitinolyticus]MBV6715938.1 cell wall metabolism sensor histidine kinase WalK [Paenibacillus chitinolyticus]
MKVIRFFQSIQAKLIIIYVLLILIAMQLIAAYFYQTLDSHYKNEFRDSINSQATLIAGLVESQYLNEPRNSDTKNLSEELTYFVNSLFAPGNTEIQIIDAGGVVLSTSLEANKQIVNQKTTKTEVTRALQGIRDNDRMFTDVDNTRKFATAKPIGSGVRVLGAVYIVSSMEDLYKTMSSINRILIVATLIALAFTAGLGVILSGTITKPIKEITQQATAAAEGNFDQSVKVYGKDEISQLGHTFNFMMNRLKEAIFINEEEKEKLASILTNMNDGVVATDEAGQIILMNRRAMQILQVKEEHSAQRHISELLGLTREEIDQYVHGERNTTLIDVPLPDDEDVQTVRVTFTTIHRRGDGVTGAIAVLQDVTEQEKLEQSRREFVANVSHELRTPLTTIKSYLEALEDGAMEDKQLAPRFLSVTRNETERMIRLVTDLLHLSRLDSKQALLTKEQTDIADMLEEVADRFSFQLRQKSIRIRIVAEPEIRPVALDRDKIDQVLDNLVSNAIKYTPDEGAITIYARMAEGDQLEISVQDTGIGIPKKDQPRIFDRFYRVDKARSRNMGGTGLGLSIAREIVKAHGGAMSLESEPGSGTKVTFMLPVLPEEENAS